MLCLKIKTQAIEDNLIYIDIRYSIATKENRIRTRVLNEEAQHWLELQDNVNNEIRYFEVLKFLGAKLEVCPKVIKIVQDMINEFIEYDYKHVIHLIKHEDVLSKAHKVLTDTQQGTLNINTSKYTDFLTVYIQENYPAHSKGIIALILEDFEAYVSKLDTYHVLNSRVVYAPHGNYLDIEL